MHHGQSTSLVDGRVPVFVFPTSLTFYADDQTSHKQVLTLYNPYEFALKFKVLSTSPRRYVVVDAEGTIKPHCCIDIVIRHSAILPGNYGITDKFRIQMLEHGHRQVIGKKDISATLVASKPEPGSSGGDTEHFEQLLPASVSHTRAQQYSIGIPRDAGGGGGTGPNIIVILAAIICILALMLPTEGQDQSSLPSYLHLSVPQKLIFAYTLGLVTMVILRT